MALGDITLLNSQNFSGKAGPEICESLQSNITAFVRANAAGHCIIDTTSISPAGVITPIDSLDYAALFLSAPHVVKVGANIVLVSAQATLYTIGIADDGAITGIIDTQVIDTGGADIVRNIFHTAGDTFLVSVQLPPDYFIYTYNVDVVGNITFVDMENVGARTSVLASAWKVSDGIYALADPWPNYYIQTRSITDLGAIGPVIDSWTIGVGAYQHLAGFHCEGNGNINVLAYYGNIITFNIDSSGDITPIALDTLALANRRAFSIYQLSRYVLAVTTNNASTKVEYITSLGIDSAGNISTIDSHNYGTNSYENYLSRINNNLFAVAYYDSGGPRITVRSLGIEMVNPAVLSTLPATGII
jgi:hypothetical protein